MKRNLEIDSLRAIAAIIVVIAHLILIGKPGLLPFGNGFATTIIDISFVISGFAISSVLIKQIDLLKGESASLIAFLKSYLVHRLSRIYPPLWTVFFMVLFLSIFFNSSNIFSSPSTIMHDSLFLLTSTFNFNFIHADLSFTSSKFSLALAPLWSLTIEEQFYLCLPIFIILTKNNAQRAKILISMIALITLVIRPTTIHYYPFEGLYFTQTRCDSFMYGCLIYILSVQPWFHHLKPSKKMSNHWAGLGFVTLMLYIIIGITTLGLSPSIYFAINGILISFLLLCATFERNIIAFPSTLQNVLHFIAPRSYTLYIIHIPIILLANEIFYQYPYLDASSISTKIAIEVLMIIASNELLYRFILIPFLAKGRNISSNIVHSAAKMHQDNETSPALRMQYAATDNAT